MAQLAQSGIVPGARASGEMLEKAEAALIRDGRVQWACVSGQGVCNRGPSRKKQSQEMPGLSTPGAPYDQKNGGNRGAYRASGHGQGACWAAGAARARC